MSDLNRPVQHEQVDNPNGVFDTTEPLLPDTSEIAGHELLPETGEEAEPVVSEELSLIPDESDLHEDEISLAEIERVEPVPMHSEPLAETQLLKPDEPQNYALLSKEELISVLHDLIITKPVAEIVNDVESIKINYYKKHKAEIERQRKAFVENGGELEEFQPADDPHEETIKELLRQFRDLKADYNKTQEDNKSKNLADKYQIIEEIKVLTNSNESINRTFHEFKELQKRWRSIGPVPQQNVKDLWENYHHHVEAFYDFIRINQELRDLDLKKNLESKIQLCEKAEELMLEPNIVSAFKSLQELHEQWREIGPVPTEMRVEIWNRFKDATAKINKKHQDHFIDLKGEQKRNLDAKTALCEKAEELCEMDIQSNKDWIARSNELVELQKVWKTIGFAPRKDNAAIYKRFRDACDKFFSRKRDYFGVFKEEQGNNLQLKFDLCVQAESLAESTEWKKTTDELIALQQRWKEIGPVPHKQSDKVWKRFRTACDLFFERKNRHFSEVDHSFAANLEKKLELIAQIEAFEITDNAEECLKSLKEFQRQWSEIGFVPLKEKEQIHDRYREAINKKFDALHIDDERRNFLKFKTKVEGYMDKPNGVQRIRQEREKYIAQLKQLESDIVLWENNIGFFARSKNAEAMIKDVENKILQSKKEIELLNKKINMIDDLDD